MFKDRTEVGILLGQKIRTLDIKNPMVLAIPRGGVPVAREIALEINAPLDLIITRKIGHPQEPEFAIGAVTQEGEVMVDERTIKNLSISSAYIKEEARRQTKEIESRMERYRGRRRYPDLHARGIIIVDDGIATGSTILAAVDSLKRKKPSSITLAVGVAPKETVSKLSSKVDTIICLDTPEPFYAIGEFYASFEQVRDEDVIQILKEVNSKFESRNPHSDI